MPQRRFDKFNAYPFFSALGDAIETGAHGEQSERLTNSSGLLGIRKLMLDSVGLLQRDRACCGMYVITQRDCAAIYAASLFTCTPAHFSSRVRVAA